jgi:DNA-binding transcriptional ArsR family regulator
VSDDVFAVIAEPNRRLILDRLLESEASVTDLITVIGLSQTAMSKHLRVLRTHNLVTSRIDAQRRIYALNSAPLTELDEWLQGYRRTWSGHVDALAAHLEAKHPQSGSIDADQPQPPVVATNESEDAP